MYPRLDHDFSQSDDGQNQDDNAYAVPEILPDLSSEPPVSIGSEFTDVGSSSGDGDTSGDCGTDNGLENDSTGDTPGADAIDPPLTDEQIDCLIGAIGTGAFGGIIGGGLGFFGGGLIGAMAGGVSGFATGWGSSVRGCPVNKTILSD